MLIFLVYNFGWKIVYVVKGIFLLIIFKIYDEECGLMIKQFIVFDKVLLKQVNIIGNFFFKGIKDGLQDNFLFLSIMVIEYEVGLFVVKEVGLIVFKQYLVFGIFVGRCFFLYIVERYVNGDVVDFGKFFFSDGWYWIVIFVGDILKFEQLCCVECFSQLLELFGVFLQCFNGFGDLL